MVTVLARLILLICLGGAAIAADKKPHVFFLLNASKDPVSPQAQFMRALSPELQVDGGAEWRHMNQRIRLSAGSPATLTAVLYGKQPLRLGVVAGADWRRKPIKSPSIATQYAKSGYTTIYSGTWGLGDMHPYNPESRGFSESVGVTARGNLWIMPVLHEDWRIAKRFESSRARIKKSMERVWRAAPPVFLLSNNLNEEESMKMTKEIAHFAREQWQAKDRETYLVILSEHNTQDARGWWGRVQQGVYYHYPANAFCFHFGLKENFERHKEVWNKVKTDWDMHGVFQSLLGGNVYPLGDFHVFHKAHWPVAESPDKYRHRGSLVVGKGHALVDGLKLYPANHKMLPDLSKPLDIAKHQRLHAEMLAAHSRWWAEARPALHNPRPFSVGEKDMMPVKLTALDWRPSKIVHQDGKSPSSQPLVYQNDVLAILQDLQDDKYRQGYPAHCGSWSLHIHRPGRYQITARLLPKHVDDEHKKPAKLRGGRAFVRLGKNLVQLQIVKGASSVTVQTDADAGITDLECWFTGQLALERELGAFFVEIQRVGEKKFELKAKPGGD